MRYGDVLAVDHLSFVAEAGQVTALLGPNGAGKTSTVEVLEGYRIADSGRVRVLGLDPLTQKAQLVERMGVMLQRGGVQPGLKVHEAVRLFCALHGDRRRPEELVALVGLGDQAGRTWKQLSGGEQQRLSLALALAGRPEVVFLDEPTASVDVAGRQVVRRIIADLAAEGCCVLLTTHELDEAERVADEVLIVDHGRLVAAGTPAQLRSQDAVDEIRFGTDRWLDTAGLAGVLDANVEEVAPGEYLARVAPTPANVATITAWLAEHDLQLTDLRAGRHRLEDVFLRLTDEGDPS